MAPWIHNALINIDIELILSIFSLYRHQWTAYSNQCTKLKKIMQIDKNLPHTNLNIFFLEKLITINLERFFDDKSIKIKIILPFLDFNRFFKLESMPSYNKINFLQVLLTLISF